MSGSLAMECEPCRFSATCVVQPPSPYYRPHFGFSDMLVSDTNSRKHIAKFHHISRQPVRSSYFVSALGGLSTFRKHLSVLISPQNLSRHERLPIMVGTTLAVGNKLQNWPHYSAKEQHYSANKGFHLFHLTNDIIILTNGIINHDSIVN